MSVAPQRSDLFWIANWSPIEKNMLVSSTFLICSSLREISSEVRSALSHQRKILNTFTATNQGRVELSGGSLAYHLSADIRILTWSQATIASHMLPNKRSVRASILSPIAAKGMLSDLLWIRNAMSRQSELGY